MTRWPVSIDHGIAVHLIHPRSDFLVSPHAIAEHEFLGIRYRQFMASESFSIPAKHSRSLRYTAPPATHDTSHETDRTIKCPRDTVHLEVRDPRQASRALGLLTAGQRAWR
jgi:hypothetical protein